MASGAVWHCWPPSEGAKVIVADYGVAADGSEPSSEVADEVVAEITAAGGEAVAVAGDVSARWRAARRSSTSPSTRYGSIDGVVCVAGILRERMLFNMTEEEFDDVVRVHLKGTFTLYRAASAVMRKQESGGSLVGFTSGVWALGSTAQANYAAAKGGIVCMTYAAALGLARYGVRANCIAPIARTRMSANVPFGLAENGDPEDVAPMVVYLLGDAAKDVTGQVYTAVGNKIAVWSQPTRAAGDVQRRALDARGDRRAPGRHDRHRAPAAAGSRPRRCAAPRRAARSRMPEPVARVELPADDDAFRAGRARLAGRRTSSASSPSCAARGGPGDEEVGFDIRVAWERLLGDAGWIGLGWPVEHGGRGASVSQQIIWAEEYSRFEAPARVNHMGENLLAPTLIAYATPELCARFLPGIAAGTERWCQGYSEPDAGSDLANVKTRAELDGDEWVINGQKVWTSLAHVSHWCFVVARTEPGSQRHKGLSFLLVPMDQPGVEIRPIVQITGGGEFNETFFSDARTDADLIVGAVGDGWAVAMGLLGFERGISTLAQQVGFERELLHTRRAGPAARASTDDPVIRQRLAAAHTGLQLMRWNAQRSMSHKGVPGPEASISKLFWGTWHRDLGELMIDILGADGQICPDGEGDPDAEYPLSLEQKLFLFTRSDTIYGGSNEIQRNVLAERVLGLPR